jgi:hypothetical protein
MKIKRIAIDTHPGNTAFLLRAGNGYPVDEMSGCNNRTFAFERRQKGAKLPRRLWLLLVGSGQTYTSAILF